ncbi:hypothetical protein PybrP1_013131 [[Pythium] brassicae (nom. inval.)]|nr:hypothetical protein PybrP1_013131 [[Pythium] brassicae (nom. inval.)]
MQQEEAALRAKIQALRNVLQDDTSPSVPSAAVASIAPSVPRAATAAASWKRPLKVTATPRQHATYQTVLAKRARSRMQLRVLKLEDGEYAKANGGFSLIRAGVTPPKPTRTLSSSTMTTRASNYVVAKSGRSLKRMAIGDAAFKAAVAKQSAPPHAANPASAASRAQAAVLRARNARTKKQKLVRVRTEYCYCKKQNACSFIHDSRRVAICRKFLRDECSDAQCLLSHTHDQNKMPVCALFLRGACTRDDCKYRHVKVSPSAQPCPAFLAGNLCPDGDACRLKHELPPKKRVVAAGAADGTSASAPAAAKRARTHARGADESGALDQENQSPSGGAAPNALESSSSSGGGGAGLSIRPTIRFRPRHATGLFPSLGSVRKSLTD